MVRAEIEIEKGSSPAVHAAARAAAAQAIAIVKRVAVECGFAEDVVIHMEQRRAPAAPPVAKAADPAWPAGDLASPSTWSGR